MRRFLALAILSVLGFGPMAWLLPGSEDARLPICCRRHGAHHCSMSMAEGGSSGTPQLAAPSHCPQYGHSLPVISTPFVVAKQPALTSASKTRTSPIESLPGVHADSNPHPSRGPPVQA